MASSFPKLPEHLVPSKQLGKGAYGTVYLCDDIRSGEQCAVKYIKDAVRGGKSTLRELVLLARLKHDNVMSLLDFPAVSSPNFKDVFLVLPFMHTDLHKVIRSGKELSERHVQAISCQILRGLSYLHGSGVAHRDLKPANILLTDDCKVKIADFGLARGDMPEEADDVNEPILTEYVVTRWYRAPEIMLLPQRYTPAVDIWSVGCIVCEMLRGKPLFPGKSHVDMLRLYGEVRGGPQAEDIEWLPKSEARDLLLRYCPFSKASKLRQVMPRASDDGLDLCHELLAWDPSERPCASKAQEHAYLRRYLPKTAPLIPETFDWSFDNFKASTSRVSERLYAECARLHPEIIRRDHDELVQRGFFDRVKGPIRSSVKASGARSRTPRASTSSSFAPNDRFSVTGGETTRRRGSTADSTGLQGEASSRLWARPGMDPAPIYRSKSVRTLSKTSTTEESVEDDLMEAASMLMSRCRRNTSMPSKGSSQTAAPVAAPQFDNNTASQAAMWRRRPSREELPRHVQPDGTSSHRSSSTCAARTSVHDDAPVKRAREFSERIIANPPADVSHTVDAKLAGSTLAAHTEHGTSPFLACGPSF